MYFNLNSLFKYFVYYTFEKSPHFFNVCFLFKKVKKGEVKIKGKSKRGGKKQKSKKLKVKS